MNALHSPISPSYLGGGDVISLAQARARRNSAELAYRLSDRERAVLAELARGHATGEIADVLILSPHTIRSHVKAAMRKLNAHTRAHAVAIALSAGAIEAV
jgi:DNA-binding CsgD family transcriptional regulator